MQIIPSVHTDNILKVVRRAEREVMAIYSGDGNLSITYKADTSPVTVADRQAHTILTDGLASLDASIPIVSEEQDESINLRNMQSDIYWLIDPIDGTKEFVAHNGQFTICVALMKDRKPIFGVVSAPALGLLYYGGKAYSSYKITSVGDPIKIDYVVPGNIVYGSLSHSNEATQDYIKNYFPECEQHSVGSQLKFVYVADGQALAYPRIGSTMKIWDIAAGHAILEGVGGTILRPSGDEIDYTSTNMLAGDFIARIR